jgi:ABC-type spermidine/putrescine transport system permease subunit I
MQNSHRRTMQNTGQVAERVMGEAGIGALEGPIALAPPRAWRVATFGLPPAALVMPLLVFLGLFYAYPVASMMWRSVGDPHLTTAHYRALFSSDIYFLVFWITLRISIVTTLGALVLGYPVAYLLARLPTGRANLLLIVVLIPFWTSILVRTYAWMVILGRDGIINQLLLSLGIIQTPLRLLNTTFAVYVAMVHVLLPFMILPLYATLRGIDPALLRAAASLGARPAAAFRQVLLPLSLPGVFAGSLLVFILALGFFITPALVGGPRDLMIAILIQQQVNLLNWPFASALAVVLLIAAAGSFALLSKALGVERLFGRA